MKQWRGDTYIYIYIYISMARAREGKYVSRIVRRIGNKHGFTQCQRSFRVVSWLAFGNKQRAKTFYDPSPPVQTATALKQSTALQLRRGIVAARGSAEHCCRIWVATRILPIYGAPFAIRGVFVRHSLHPQRNGSTTKALRHVPISIRPGINFQLARC